MQNLYSFDVFDTLITRTTATPSGIFAIMKNVLTNSEQYSSLPDRLKENFFIIRKESEIFVRNNKKVNNIKEITLDDIYSIIETNIPLTPEQKKQLMELEISIEKENSVAIWQNITKLRDLVENGKHVVLISDMYLSMSVIRELLLKHDNIFANVNIYVSSEYGETKNDGGLYKIVMKLEHPYSQTWLHIGNNQKGDVDIPNSYGIKTMLYSFPNLLPYEKAIINKFPDDAYISISVGTSRNLRLFHNEQYSDKYELGSSMGGPLLFPYIDWLANQVEHSEIHTLYFIMRDGDVLKKLFDILATKKGISIKTKLLYGSRLAWTVPSITKKNIKHTFNVLHFISKNKINSIEQIAYILHISSKELIKYIPSNFIELDGKFDNKTRVELFSSLFKNQDFIKYVEDSNLEQRNLIKDYIKQEFELKDNKFAIIDLLGSGTTQESFLYIMNEIKRINLNLFYANFSTLKISNEQLKMLAFSTKTGPIAALEFFCRSEQGQTISYKKQNDMVVPVLDEIEGIALKNYKYNEIIKGELDYTSTFNDILNINSSIKINYKLYNFYIDYINLTPDLKLADILGDLPYSFSIGSFNKINVLAPKIPLKKIIFDSKKSLIKYNSFAVTRSSKLVKTLLKVIKKYGSLRKFIFHINISLTKKKFYLIILGIKLFSITFKKGL